MYILTASGMHCGVRGVLAVSTPLDGEPRRCSGLSARARAQTAIGHWGEMMFPLFSILREEAAFAQPPAQFVLLHLKRAHLMEWVRAVMAAALAVPRGGALPRLLMQAETPSAADQTCAPPLPAAPWAKPPPAPHLASVAPAARCPSQGRGRP